MDDDERTRSARRGIWEAISGGDDTARLLALSDGVFAFAMTLLVISFKFPGMNSSESLGQYFVDLRTSFAEYALSFVVIGSWWLLHHRVFAWIERYDSMLQWLNLFFLMIIAFTPLLLATLIFYGISTPTVILYSGVQAGAGLIIVAIWAYASEGHRLIDRSMSDALRRALLTRSFVAPAIFGIAIGLAFLNAYLALVAWATLIVAQRVLPAVARRRHWGEEPTRPAS